MPRSFVMIRIGVGDVCRRVQRRRRQGFTLIELLVALAMVAVLATSLYMTLQAAFKARSSATEALAPVKSAEMAMQLLREDFQNALQPAGPPSTTTVRLVGNFEGTQQTDDRAAAADDVQFFTTSYGPQHVDANGDVKEVEITVIPDPNKNDHVLVRKVLGNLTAQIQPMPDQEVLCRGVAGFSVRYYDGSEWLTNWDSTQEDNTIPAAVELTLQLNKPVKKGQPDQTYTMVRVFPLSCSTAALDTNVNSGLQTQ